MNLEELLADVSVRFGSPHAPEIDALWHGRLRGRELRAELPGAAPSRRGAILRMLGDAAGARAAWRSALRTDPQDAAVGLSELELGSAAAEARLSRALDRGDDAAARLARGAGRLIRGARARKGAVEDLARASALAPASAAAAYLLGLAREDGGDLARAGALGFWSAPHLVLAGRGAAGAADGALDRDPNLALVAASTFKPGGSLDERLASVVATAVGTPERFASFDGLRGLFRPQLAREQLEACRALTVLRPDRAWAWALLGRALLRDGKDAGAAREGLDALDRAAAALPEAGWVYAWRAQAHIALRDLERALADFDRCADRQPFYHRVYAWRGGLLARMGLHERAVADLDRAVDFDPEYHFAWRQRALARRAAGDLPAAARDLARAYRLKPKYEWNPKDSGGGAPPVDAAGDLKELDAAVAERGALPELLLWRGRTKLRAGDAAGAEKDLRAALAKDEGSALARAWLAKLMLDGGRAAEGRAQLRRAVKDDPGFWTLHAWLARADFDAGRAAEAFAALKRLAKRRPAPWAYALLAELYEKKRRFREAAAAADAAASLDGQHGQAFLLAARARFALGDEAGGRAALARATELIPESAELAALTASRAGKA